MWEDRGDADDLLVSGSDRGLQRQDDHQGLVFFDQIDLGVGQIIDFRQNIQEFPFSIVNPTITITITITKQVKQK